MPTVWEEFIQGRLPGEKEAACHEEAVTLITYIESYKNHVSFYKTQIS